MGSAGVQVVVIGDGMSTKRLATVVGRQNLILESTNPQTREMLERTYKGHIRYLICPECGREMRGAYGAVQAADDTDVFMLQWIFVCFRCNPDWL